MKIKIKNTVPLDDDIARIFHIRDYPGYLNPFTRDEALDAKFKNGVTVRKAIFEKGDNTPLDTQGTVLGSIYVPDLGTAYFIEWDSLPHVAIFIVEAKLK